MTVEITAIPNTRRLGNSKPTNFSFDLQEFTAQPFHNMILYYRYEIKALYPKSYLREYGKPKSRFTPPINNAPARTHIFSFPFPGVFRPILLQFVHDVASLTFSFFSECWPTFHELIGQALGVGTAGADFLEGRPWKFGPNASTLYKPWPAALWWGGMVR